MASLFEEMGGTYTLSADGMYYPNLELPEEETPRYGKYGRMRHTYPREHKKAFYATLLFDTHLNEIDDAANPRMELITKKICLIKTLIFKRQNRSAARHKKPYSIISPSPYK